MQKKQKILIIQTAFIGDVVLATGILEKLHVFFPEAELDFLVRKGNESLFAGHPFLHEVLIWDKKKQKLRNLWQMLTVISSRRYDFVINIHRFATTGFLTAFSRAKQRIGYDKNPFSFAFTRVVKHEVSTKERPVHEIDRCNALISSITDGQSYLPKLYPTASDDAVVNELKSRPYICIAPASVWFTKQYPEEQWIDFLEQLPSSLQVYLLGGRDDVSLGERLRISEAKASITNLCGQLTFLQSAALMRDAQMNYVNDSSPMHFASAVNAPVTPVYCSTIPAFGFGPLSDVRHVVELEEPLPCRPCGLHGYEACPRVHFKCARLIRTQQLLDCL
jgi:ADP-heptose:LPS heptosyltransferase